MREQNYMTPKFFPSVKPYAYEIIKEKIKQRK